MLVLERERHAGLARARRRTTSALPSSANAAPGSGSRQYENARTTGADKTDGRLERTLVDALLRDRIVVPIALEERRGDRADVESHDASSSARIALQRVGCVVDDLHAVDRAQLDRPDPELLADVECRPEASVDLVRDHAQLHARRFYQA